MSPDLGSMGRWGGFVLALILLQGVLAVAPDDPGYYQTLFIPTLELAGLTAVFAFSPKPLRRVLRVAVLVLLAVLVLFKLADGGFQAAFDRNFDPVLDFYLLPDGWTLLSGSIGAGRAAATVVGVLAAYILLLLLLHLALGRLSAMSRTRLSKAGAAVAAAAFAVLAFAPSDYGPAPSAALVAAHLKASAASLADTVGFRNGLTHDPSATVPNDRLLSALAGKDVVLVFVESYGRDALEDPRYAPLVNARLDAAQKELGSAGFQARSAWLMSPTFGGQSWLAHETLLSGLWVTGGGRYNELIKSKRATLIRDFGRAGWRTVAVMPAIAEAWPEGGYFGFDQIYDAHTLGYRGLPFNWITMPDQYTLSALQKLELGRPDRKPVMAEVSLISSHAPFVPIPPMLPWDAVGDGKIYDKTVKGSEPPDSVWADMRRVGQAYAQSIDYSLASLAGFVKTYGDDRLVMIVLGDHQPGNVITAQGASHEVPIHIFAKDAKVLAAIDGWGWTRGMHPPPGPSKWRMDRLRGELLKTFSRAADLPRSLRP